MSKIINQTNCDNCVYKTWAFETLDSAQLARVNQNKTEMAFEKGEIIIKEGCEVRHFLYLQKGLAKLHKEDESGREHIISIAQPLDFIGLLNVFSNTQHSFSLTALSETIICFVDIEVLTNLMKENGDFALDFIKKISTVTDRIISSQVAINSHQLKGRVAHILLLFADNVYGSDTYNLPINRKEISELINMSTENVIRTLSEFRKENIIEIEGTQITIKNKDRLKKIERLG